MKKVLATVVLTLVLCASVPAALYPFTSTISSPNGDIPDNPLLGLEWSQTVSGIPNTVSTLDLVLNFASGANVSDLQGFLRLGDGLSVNFGNGYGGFANNATINLDLSSTFAGSNPNASWTLFLQDMDPIGTSSIVSWTMNITDSLTPVPEPTEWALIIFAVLAVLYKFVLPRLRRPALALAPVSRPVRS